MGIGFPAKNRNWASIDDYTASGLNRIGFSVALEQIVRLIFLLGDF